MTVKLEYCRFLGKMPHKKCTPPLITITKTTTITKTIKTQVPKKDA